MKDVSPVCSGTQVDSQTQEWITQSFPDFLAELDALDKSFNSDDRLLIFRGHRRREWLLDSTFVRSCKAVLFGIRPHNRWSPHVRESRQLHLSLLNLFLLKFGVLSQPSEGLFELGQTRQIDPWFEYMKRVQQHPEERHDGPFPLQGTNIIDWTKSSDVALYFANEAREGQAGAVFICDATATGKTHQVVSMDTILTKMDAEGNRGNALGGPLMFHPTHQILNRRAKNQQAIYFAQMDLRVDLELIWRLQEQEQKTDTILVKIILPPGTDSAVSEHLSARGITKDFLFPSETTPGNYED